MTYLKRLVTSLRASEPVKRKETEYKGRDWERNVANLRNRCVRKREGNGKGRGLRLD